MIQFIFIYNTIDGKYVTFLFRSIFEYIYILNILLNIVAFGFKYGNRLKKVITLFTNQRCHILLVFNFLPSQLLIKLALTVANC